MIASIASTRPALMATEFPFCIGTKTSSSIVATLRQARCCDQQASSQPTVVIKIPTLKTSSIKLQQHRETPFAHEFACFMDMDEGELEKSSCNKFAYYK